jgi:hypothetical protein
LTTLTCFDSPRRHRRRLGPTPEPQVGVVREERPGGEDPPVLRPADRLGESAEGAGRLLQTAAARRCMICPRGQRAWGVQARRDTGEAEDGRG